MENNANTIWVKAFTPGGHQVGITLAFEPGNLLSASSVDAMLNSAGYLLTPPGVEPGEEVEVMTHVMKRIHTNKNDGTKTPVIALYHENEALKHKYDHKYLNTPEEIAQFESLSGLKLSDIPEWMADNYIPRDHERASEFVKKMPNPVRVVAVEKPYEAFGKTGTTMKIQRFLDAPTAQTEPDNIIKMPTADTPFTRELADLFNEYWKLHGIGGTQALAWLGVSKLSEWQGTVNDANAVLSQKKGA